MRVASQWQYQLAKARLARARVKVWQAMRAERRDRILNPDKHRLLENPSYATELAATRHLENARNQNRIVSQNFYAMWC
jgi:hypothetical protein